MRYERHRKFGLLDLSALVAATAVGLTLSRSYAVIPHFFQKGDAREISRIVQIIAIYLSAMLPVPLMWTIALLILRFRAPRPTLRRMLRQPGVIACVAVVSSLSVRSTGLLILGFK